jgi:CRISPR-associated protein Cas2
MLLWRLNGLCLMSHSKKYLICYDIRDPKRLQKVHRTVRDFGTAVQFSVFEAELKQAELCDLKQRLEKLIDAAQDSVSFYPLTPAYQKISLGCVVNLLMQV